MTIVSNILVGIVALAHFWFLALEMFFWTKPLGMKTFGLTAEFAEASAVLASNQGLYNGFLAAGLIWALTRGRDGDAIKVFFLTCVIIAGVFGALTANPRIIIVQGAPAILALISVIIAQQSARKRSNPDST